MACFQQFRRWLLIIVIVSFGGCASTPDELEILDTTWKNYEKAMLWGEYSYCIDAHRTDKVSPRRQKELKSIKVTSYEVLKREVTPDKSVAKQIVEIKYYNKAYAVVRSLTIDQEWLYEPKSMQWIIITPFPNFK